MSNKNKIYAAISISIIILMAASFFAAVNFLLKINNLVFNVDQNIVKEQTTVLNEDGFEKIKSKLNPAPVLSPASTVLPSSEEVTPAPTPEE